jgi:hypothetical protein
MIGVQETKDGSAISVDQDSEVDQAAITSLYPQTEQHLSICFKLMF